MMTKAQLINKLKLFGGSGLEENLLDDIFIFDELYEINDISLLLEPGQTDPANRINPDWIFKQYILYIESGRIDDALIKMLGENDYKIYQFHKNIRFNGVNIGDRILADSILRGVRISIELSKNHLVLSGLQSTRQEIIYSICNYTWKILEARKNYNANLVVDINIKGGIMDVHEITGNVPRVLDKSSLINEVNISNRVNRKFIYENCNITWIGMKHTRKGNHNLCVRVERDNSIKDHIVL